MLQVPNELNLCEFGHASIAQGIDTQHDTPVRQSNGSQSCTLTMPQIKKSISKDFSFSVSPWRSKPGDPEITGDQLYQQTPLPFEKARTSSPGPSSATVCIPHAVSAHGHASQWQTKKRKSADEVGPSLQLSASDTAAVQDTADWNADSEAAEVSQGISVIGTAVLALLPNGQISGHLLDTHSNKCFGFMARQLTAERECTRDTEWKLLHATIIDFQSKKEIKFPAERTAEDAAVIQAPLQMHGEEEQIIAALQGCASTEVDFKFQCTTILVRLVLHSVCSVLSMSYELALSLTGQDSAHNNRHLLPIKHLCFVAAGR